MSLYYLQPAHRSTYHPEATIQTMTENQSVTTIIDDDQLTVLEQAAINNGQLLLILEKLHNLEKQCRKLVDPMKASRILTAIVRILFATNQWEKLSEAILYLSKRPSQFDSAVQCMIQQCMAMIENCPLSQQRVFLIETLCCVCRGKLSMEIEYARLTKMLATHKEQAGELTEAAAIMNKLQVDVLIEMDRRERIALILDQIRLNLLTKCPDIAHIFATRIKPTAFTGVEYNRLKFKYYGLRIQIDRDRNNLETSKHFQAVLDTVEMRQSSKRKKLLTFAILYCVLNVYTVEQYNMMVCLMKHQFAEEVPVAVNILRLMLSTELISWNLFCDTFKIELEKLTMFNVGNKHGIRCWRELIFRIIEHNIRIISMYYIRITMKRISELLELTAEKCEEILCRMIGERLVRAKIDRPAGIVVFDVDRMANEDLNDWLHENAAIMKNVQQIVCCINADKCNFGANEIKYV